MLSPNCRSARTRLRLENLRTYLSLKLLFAAIAQSVQRLATGCTAPWIESRCGGEIFRTRPDRSWGPPSLQTIFAASFAGLKRTGHGVDQPTPPSAEVNPLNPELNPICYLLVLLGDHHFLHVSRIRVKLLTFRRLMSYIYMENPFLMFLDHTQRRSTVGRTPLDE